MDTQNVNEELDRLSLLEDSLVKRYYAVLTEPKSRQRDAEIRRLENQLRQVRARIAKLEGQK